MRLLGAQRRMDTSWAQSVITSSGQLKAPRSCWLLLVLRSVFGRKRTLSATSCVSTQWWLVMSRSSAIRVALHR